MFYVYALIDPRNNKPFYIGKGKGNRINQHEREAKSNKFSHKLNVIRAIWADGLSVKKKILKYFELEDDAYSHEIKLIKRIGLKNLSNHSAGGRIDFSNKEISADKTKLIVAAKILGIKEKGMIPVIRFCGIYKELSNELISKIITMAKEVISRRGKEWCERALFIENRT